MAIFEIYGYSHENLEVIMAIFEIIPIFIGCCYSNKLLSKQKGH